MTNQPSPEIDAAIARLNQAKQFAISELYVFTDYLRTVDPELMASEAMTITGYVLYQLPNLFKENPNILADIKEIATKIKLQRSDISNS
ncbi:hypothetical protein H6G04_22240 [Calothrix membranacea FACHB-236]|nr:hypothetical protein [Calothrix membranacea FACHB-236]